MAESKHLFCVLLLAAVLRGAFLQTNSTICPSRSYSMDPSGQQCYRYIESPKDFFDANRTCEREGGGMLLRIDSARENEYVRARFFVGRGLTEFWIGLNDIDQEGVFRWVDGNEAVYTNWSPSFPPATENRINWDCVKFAADGWRLHESGCAVSNFPFVCKMRPCQSRDGNVCIGSEPTMMAAQGPDVGLIVGIVVVILVIFAVIVLVIVLLLMWKFANDAFYRYVCCCVSGGSRSAMHSLQQENQRLRHELSQHKVSLSGRYSQGFFKRELSGVPDGRGGVLPTIKQPPLGTAVSPTIPEDRPLNFPSSQPPPLALQRSISRPSRVTPLTSPFSPPQSFTTPSIFTAGQWAQQGTKVSLPPGRLTRQSVPAVKLTFPPSSVEKIKEEEEEEEVKRGEEKMEMGKEKPSEHDTSSNSSASSVDQQEEKAA